MNPQLRQQINVLRQDPKYKTLILPEQITTVNFPFLNATQVSQYAPGLNTFWQALASQPESNPQHLSAFQKLTTFSNNLITQLSKFRQQHAQAKQAEGAASGQQNGATSKAQISQPQAQPVSQIQTQQSAPPPAQAQAQANSQAVPPPQQAQSQTPQLLPQQSEAQSELPPEIRQRIETMHFEPPPNLQGDAASAWRLEAQKRYSKALLDQYKAKANIVRADQLITTARSQGKEIPPGVLELRGKEEERHKKGQELIDQLTRSQNTGKAVAQAATRVINNAQQANGQMMQGQNIANGLQARPTSQDQQQPVNPAIATAQQQMRASMTPPINGQQQQTASHLNQTLPTFTQQQPFNLQRPQPNPTQAAQLKFPTPPSGMVPGSITGQSPVPLTHQGAIAAAGRTYSQQTPGGIPQAPSTSGSFSGRPDLDKTTNKYPTSFNKGWTPQTPQPVSMGAARPTLTGPQSGPMGMMGQPAIQKPPAFLLQGQGDRVLDKKKLDELVRQVTGGSGEGLQPEVEEVSSCNTADLLILSTNEHFLVCPSARRRVYRQCHHQCVQARKVAGRRHTGGERHPARAGAAV